MPNYNGTYSDMHTSGRHSTQRPHQLGQIQSFYRIYRQWVRTTIIAIWSKTTPLDTRPVLWLARNLTGVAQSKNVVPRGLPRGRSRIDLPTFLSLYLAIYPYRPEWLMVKHQSWPVPGQLKRLWLMSLCTASGVIAKISGHRFCTEIPASQTLQLGWLQTSWNRWSRQLRDSTDLQKQ